MIKKNQKIQIGDEIINPGERRVVMLPMPELYDCSPMYMPINVICGRRPGPVLTVIAAVHGDEINGVEIVRRLMRRKALNQISGTLITIPIVNVYGFIYQSRYLMDRRDLNRSFPGKKTGSLAARLANFIIQEIVVKSTHIIDLHTGSLHRSNIPQIRATLDKNNNRELAQVFGAPVILNSTIRDGSLRQAVSDLNLPFILYEAGEALRFDGISIRTGLRGIMNVMRFLNMVPSRLVARHQCALPAFAYSSKWMRAKGSGILVPRKRLGDHINKGEALGLLANPLSADEIPVVSTCSGIIIGKTNLPLVHEGEALFHIARVDEPSLTSEQIMQLRDI